MNFSDIFKSVVQYFTPGLQDENLAKSLQAFKDFLNDGKKNPTIRVWVSGIVDSGFQANTTSIIYQLTNKDDAEDTDVKDEDKLYGFGYAGTIEVYYKADKDGVILKMLFALLPSLNNEKEGGKVNNATVNLIEWTDSSKPPETAVVLGFTGGEDQASDSKGALSSPTLAKQLNAGYLLRLEPYQSTLPEEIQFSSIVKPNINLAKMDLLAKGSFKQRAYRTVVAEPDWSYYSAQFKEQVAIIQSLLGEKESYDIAVVNNISTGGNFKMEATPEERMFEAVAGYMASQMNTTTIRNGAKPIVVLSVDDFANDTSGAQSTLEQLLFGCFTTQECAWDTELNPGKSKKTATGNASNLTESRRNQLVQNLKPATYRKSYLNQVNPKAKLEEDNRINFIWNPTEENVTAKYSFLNKANNKVLFVQLGNIPAPVLEYLLTQATLPAVLNSNNIVNLTLQTGNPFFIVPDANAATVQYPTTLLGYSESDEYDDLDDTTLPVIYVPGIVTLMQDVANNINYSLEAWPASVSGNPAENIGRFIKDYGDEADSPEYHAYYKSMQEFYHDVANDKFRVACSYFAYVLEGTGAIKPPVDDPLGDLLANIYKNLDKDNNLNLFPGVYGSGAIYKFVSGLIGVNVVLSKATVSPAKDTKKPESITVTGNTNVFDSVPLSFEIEFTAPDGIVVSNWKMTYTGDWLTTELPWLLFDQPYVLLTVADTTMPSQGGVGGVLRGLDLDLSIRQPIDTGVWQLEGHFEKPASIARFYQMAGGVNLVQSLPSPFNAFTAIGVTDCQLAYNQKTGTIEYVSFVMTTGETVNLMTGLKMDSITFNVLIQEPGSIAKRKTTWSVMGKFLIGDPNAADVGVVMLGMKYPGPVFTGQLAKGVIKVADLFNLFLPGTVFDPKDSGLPVVTEFVASFNGTTGDYSVTSKLNFDWTFSIAQGAPKLTIKDVGVQVQSKNKQLQGGISGGFIFGSGDDQSILSATLSANYDSKKGWVFKGKQTTGTTLSLSALISAFLPEKWKITSNDYKLKNLSFTLEQAKSYYEFGGETDGYWTIPFIQLNVRADLKFGYGNYKSDTGSKDSKVAIVQSNGKTLAVAEDNVGYYCRLNADIDWLGIKMNVFFDYNPDVQKYGFTWGVLTGLIEEKEVEAGKPKHWIGTLSFTESVTLGSMIEEAISWLSGYKYGLAAPWNLLNSLSLSALQLKYDFTTSQVSFKLDIGEINLGFCKIKSIGIAYKQNQPNKEDNGVIVTIDGSFFWITEDDGKGQSPNQLNWDAAKPETTPAPSGQGNKYFDLRLLALGQHVTLPGFANVTSVQDAIKEMAKLPDTDAGEIPGITFDSNSSWLVGMDFGVLRLGGDKSTDGNKSKALMAADTGGNDDETGYFINMQIVFNDPNLYALRIALSGAPARIFKGLDFQILYRKISDSVGVYMAEIALPDVMRKIQLGAVNITLPVFAIEIYTNGDFLVDLGFPKNADFSRSFTLQMIIYVPIPIPVMGSAGLYFGKKSSATSTEVPVISNGTFNPVLVFGIGLQFGLGYDFNAGILAAGFSLTFVTIIEGVLAKFNPYQNQDTSTGQQADIAPAYYYSVKGVVGIQAKLYGYVDFKIIKAEVSIQFSVLADITIAAYKPILLGLTVYVSVSVSVKINLGFFSISIGFSFKMTIRASYEIKAGGGKSPWDVVSDPKTASRTLLNANTLTASKGLRAMSFLAATTDVYNDTPTWANLTAATTKADLKGYIGFGLSIAGDMATQTAQQQAVYTAMLFIDSVDTSSTKKDMTAADTSFEILSKQIFRWVIAAFHNGSISAGDVDKLAISQTRLDIIYNYLNDDTNTNPIPAGDIDTFMIQQVTLKVSHPSTTTGTANAAYFPVAPKLSMSLPANGSQPALNYSFDGYNNLSDTYIDNLRIYFDELAVQLNKDESANAALRAMQVTNNPESLATFIYTDYFLLIARQMIHNAQNALSSFQYNIVPGQTGTDIINWINTNGQFEGGYSYTITDLFNDNKSHILTTGKGINISQSTYSTISDDTFDSIYQKSIYNNGFTAAQLATLNADNTTILQSGSVLTYPNKDAVVVQAGNTLNDLAKVGFNVSLADLLNNSNALTLKGLLMPSSALQLPAFNGLTQAEDTLISFSGRYGVSIDALAQNNLNAAVKDLFDINDNNGILNMTELPQFNVGELIKEIQADQGLQQLSGMASRYYLSGLRLPTDGITAKYQGMWLNDKLVYQEATAGLFSLTGQQFALPVLQPKETYTISFTIPSSLTWFSFDTGNATLDIAITQDSDTYAQIDVVRSYAQKNYLDLSIENLGLGDMFNSSYVHYTFSTVAPWQAGSNILLPYSGATGEAQTLTIWTLPSDLISLADPTGRAITPRFQVQEGTVDAATQAIISKPIKNYGWGTQVDFTVKKVPVSPDSPASANTYEISGADGNNALILERMVTYIGTDDSLIDSVIFGFAPSQSNGSNPGIQTDPVSSLTIGIAQANMSTFTRPASVQSMAFKASLQAESEQSNLLNKPTDLIKLLWQASITRDGGYYLYYFNKENGEGLPDHAFNDKGEAVLSLLTIYSAPQDVNTQDLLQPYMNMFVTATPIDVNSSSIYAQAAPITQNVIFKNTDTLTGIGYQYFTNIGDVVSSNPTAQLRTNIDVRVPEGTYQVTATTGESLQTIADKFGTTVPLIQAANPLETNWPAVLPLYTGLRLPDITVKGSTNANTQTLPAIAAYYGMDLTALANYNADTPGLFADNTTLKMIGGPISRTATVPAGVVSLEAFRKEPDPVPAKPADANYASLFLQHNFSILTFQLAENSWFRPSNPSLPAGPTDPDTNNQNQVNGGDDLTGKWIFKQSVPYYKFANLPKQLMAAGLPDASTSPYKGIGYLVQPDFMWLDIYGNNVLTTLAQPTTGNKIMNEAPILTGYTDALLGISQWPSVSSSWMVTKENGASIQVPLSFDTTQYNGLLSAQALKTNNTEVVLTFTEALDTTTANTIANYKLTPDVTVTAATLQSNGTTVKLTVSALAEDMAYTIAIGNIKKQNSKITYDGQATFSLTDAGGTDIDASSSIIQQATHDFQVYTQLWYQLTDTNGMQLSMQTTLFDDIFNLPAATYNDLVQNWVASIYLYLQDRSQGGITVTAPKPLYTLSFGIDPTKANQAQIFELTLSISIARTGGAIMGDFETTGSVKKVTTLLSAATDSNDETSRGLDNFADTFEDAMSVSGQYYLKIATGADRDKLGQQKPDGTIWATRLGLNNSNAIEYSITNENAPILFAPRPVSNKLESRSQVPIYNYTTGNGINFNKPDYLKDFTEIDMDQWIATFFSSMDNILTPEFTASIQLVDKKMTTSYLHSIQGSKESLADIAKLLMTNVFVDESADPTDIQAAMKQSLLVKLMNLYATNSGVQFNVNVKADPTADTPPNLYGGFMQNTTLEGAVSNEEDPKKVTLYFSSPLDPISAVITSNYTLTTPLTVVSASLNADAQSVVLETSAAVTIGTTQVTVGDGLLDANKREIQGIMTYVVATSYESYAKTDQLTISSAKIKLDSSEEQSLAFLLSSPEIVRGQDGEVLSMINLNLSYKGTDIEHQIDKAINGFTPSSWLSFVLPNVRVPLESQLGGFSVPMFLRSFPQNPALVNQSGIAPNLDSPDISTLLQWIYAFDYSQSFHYPQDTLHFTVDFNVCNNVQTMLKAFPDAFNQLAEFITVYPSIEADLKTIVTQIDANVYYETGADADTLFKNANIALQSFTQVVQNIVTAAKGSGLKMPSHPKPFGSTNVDPYVFEIKEGPKGLDGKQVQVVSIKNKPPEGVGTPEVLISPDTYQITVWPNEEPPVNDEVYYYYYYVNKTTGEPLTSEAAQEIQQRTVQLPGLNILQRQDAMTTVHLKRNEDLVKGKTTNPDFVYTTGDLSFSNAYLPTINSYQEIEIANLPQNQGQPTVRTLFEQLQTLMATLLKENEEPGLSFQMTCSYDYYLNPEKSDIVINLPVFMQSMIPVTLATGLDPMLQSWANAMNGWQKNNQPNTNKGAYRLDLIIFSNLTQQPFPLVRLENLKLSLVYISPDSTE